MRVWEGNASRFGGGMGMSFTPNLPRAKGIGSSDDGVPIL
jgi:hypothetical protein